MNHENLPKDESEQAPDVFDMAMGHEAAHPSHDDTHAGMRGPRTNTSGVLARIGPRHFAGLAVAIAVVWIAWPAENSRVPSSANSSLLNTQLRSATPSSTSTPNDLTGKNVASEALPVKPVAPALDSPEASGSPQSETAGHIIQAQAQQAAALIAAIDNLGARLDVVETRLNTPEKASIVSTEQSSTYKTIPRQKHVRSNEHARTSADKSVAPVVPGYSLNTIYTGQAWIVRDGHVNVVRQGDVIDDFKVIRIDARAHQVLTSRGIIR